MSAAARHEVCSPLFHRYAQSGPLWVLDKKIIILYNILIVPISLDHHSLQEASHGYVIVCYSRDSNILGYLWIVLPMRYLAINSTASWHE